MTDDYRTACLNLARTGKCRFGRRCRHSHDNDRVESTRERMARAAEQLCPALLAGTECRRGERQCWHSHDAAKLDEHRRHEAERGKSRCIECAGNECEMRECRVCSAHVCSECWFVCSGCTTRSTNDRAFTVTCNMDHPETRSRTRVGAHVPQKAVWHCNQCRQECCALCSVVDHSTDISYVFHRRECYTAWLRKRYPHRERERAQIERYFDSPDEYNAAFPPLG